MTIRKPILAVALLALAVGGLGYALIRQGGGGGGDGLQFKGDKLYVICFYVAERCTSCQRMADWTRELVDERYAGQQLGGKLQFAVVDVEQPSERHFVGDFKLTGSTLVLARVRDGKVASYESLDGVWSLIDKHDEFNKLVSGRIDAMLGTGK